MVWYCVYGGELSMPLTGIPELVSIVVHPSLFSHGQTTVFDPGRVRLVHEAAAPGLVLLGALG